MLKGSLAKLGIIKKNLTASLNSGLSYSNGSYRCSGSGAGPGRRQRRFSCPVDRHSRSIFRVVYRITGSQQAPEELVQETFLRAYKSLERFELRANFSTWVYRIAVNRTLDFLNARKT